MQAGPVKKVRISKLPYRVQKAVVKGGTVVVMVDIPLGEPRARNIYGVGRDGTLKWRINPPTDDEGRVIQFADIYTNGNGKVYGRTIGGKRYIIDEETGQLSSL